MHTFTFSGIAVLTLGDPSFVVI